MTPDLLTELAEMTPSCSLVGSMRGGWLKAIIAGALLWVAMYLIATAFQPAHAGSVMATIEIGLSLIVSILACLLLRW